MFVLTEMISSPQSPATVQSVACFNNEKVAIKRANDWIKLFYKQVVKGEYGCTKDDVIEKSENYFHSIWLVKEDVYCEVKIVECDVY